MTALGLQPRQQPNQPHYWEISHTRLDGNSRPVATTTLRAPVPSLSTGAKVAIGLALGIGGTYICMRRRSPKPRKLSASRR